MENPGSPSPAAVPFRRLSDRSNGPRVRQVGGFGPWSPRAQPPIEHRDLPLPHLDALEARGGINCMGEVFLAPRPRTLLASPQCPLPMPTRAACPENPEVTRRHR